MGKLFKPGIMRSIIQIMVLILVSISIGYIIGSQAHRFLANVITTILKNPEPYEIQYSFAGLDDLFKIFGILLAFNFSVAGLYIYDRFFKNNKE